MKKLYLFLFFALSASPSLFSQNSDNIIHRKSDPSKNEIFAPVTGSFGTLVIENLTADLENISSIEVADTKTGTVIYTDEGLDGTLYLTASILTQINYSIRIKLQNGTTIYKRLNLTEL